MNISDKERKQLRKTHRPRGSSFRDAVVCASETHADAPAWPCVALRLLEVLEHPDNARLLNAMDAGDRTRALLIANQAMELGRLKNFIYEIFDEDCGLAVWEPGYDGGKYSDIAADAKAVWDAKMEEPDG